MSKPVLLALSSFRRTDEEIEHALAVCVERGRPLLVAFIVDVNLARYFAGSGVMAGTSLRKEMENGILAEHTRKAHEVLERVSGLAADRGIACDTRLSVGRFAAEIEAIAVDAAPELIIVTRAKRAGWLRGLFGSPIDRLRSDLGDRCEVEII